MNLLLLRSHYPIVIISNERRNDYINAIAYGQSNNDELDNLIDLVLSATRSSLIETLSLIVTAADSPSKGQPIYEEIIEFLNI